MPLEDGEIEGGVCDGRIYGGGVFGFVVRGLNVVCGIDCICHDGRMQTWGGIIIMMIIIMVLVCSKWGCSAKCLGSHVLGGVGVQAWGCSGLGYGSWEWDET